MSLRALEFNLIGTLGRTEIGEPYRYYAKWDDLYASAKEKINVKVRLNGKPSRIYELDHVIPHLAANYFHYDLQTDNNIRSLTFTHPYDDGREPTARVHAIVKIRNQDWKQAGEIAADFDLAYGTVTGNRPILPLTITGHLFYTTKLQKINLGGSFDLTTSVIPHRISELFGSD